MRYQVDEREPFGQHNTRVFRVTPVRAIGGPNELMAVDVWGMDAGRLACTKCSGPLQAMLANCKHTAAVRRHLARIAP